MFIWLQYLELHFPLTEGGFLHVVLHPGEKENAVKILIILDRNVNTQYTPCEIYMHKPTISQGIFIIQCEYKMYGFNFIFKHFLILVHEKAQSFTILPSQRDIPRAPPCQ